MHASSTTVASLLLMAGTAAFVATAIGEHRSVAELVQRSDARAHALQAQLLLRRTGALLVNLETGQRGFLITGDPAFLEPYERARLEWASTHEALKRHLVPSGQAQPEELARLERLSQQRIAQMARNIARRWAEGEAMLKDLPSYVAGKRLMDEIRGELVRLEVAQDQLISAAERDAEEVQRVTSRLAVILPAIGSLLIIGAVLALLHERRRRDRAEAALKNANNELESQVGVRTAELRAALERIQHFATELDGSVEAERKRLAREVHDQVGQVATAIKMLVLGMRKRLPPGHEEEVGELLSLADESIATARQISAALRPPLLDDFGLGAALEHYGKDLARQSGLEVQVAVADDAALSSTQANQLFRIAQEAATNALRHAHAKRLVLRGEPRVDCYSFEVIDDGRGPGDVRADAAGLRNMRERAAMAGGRLEFGPAEGGGTRVGVLLALDAVTDGGQWE